MRYCIASWSECPSAEDSTDGFHCEQLFRQKGGPVRLKLLDRKCLTQRLCHAEQVCRRVYWCSIFLGFPGWRTIIVRNKASSIEGLKGFFNPKSKANIVFNPWCYHHMLLEV